MSRTERLRIAPWSNHAHREWWVNFWALMPTRHFGKKKRWSYILRINVYHFRNWFTTSKGCSMCELDCLSSCSSNNHLTYPIPFYWLFILDWNWLVSVTWHAGSLSIERPKSQVARCSARLSPVRERRAITHVAAICGHLSPPRVKKEFKGYHRVFPH